MQRGGLNGYFDAVPEQRLIGALKMAKPCDQQVKRCGQSAKVPGSYGPDGLLAHRLHIDVRLCYMFYFDLLRA